VTQPGAQAWVPEGADLGELAAAARACRGCELYADAEQVVFGAGPPHPRAVLVGEQPGDVEDHAGEPFVGPAGKLLRRALQEVGLPAEELYLTNAVKHFRFERRGNRRLHKTPGVTHIRACRPWLDCELAAVRPDAVATLGAIAAKALLGPKFRLTSQRGQVLDWEGRRLVATVHPSAILRVPVEARDEALAALVADLQVVAALRP
jgi:DNA polymerase